MGCCLSTGDRHHEAENRHSSGEAPPRSPPAAPEEETVKEVLLETTVAPKVDERIKGTPLGDRELKVEAQAGPKAVINGYPDPPGKADEEIVCEISEVSEMCSYSESFSNATAQEKRDDDEDGVVNQRPPLRKRRVPAGGRGRGRGERVVARRPSPEKRGQVAPLRPARGRAMAGQPRTVAEENGRRRDPGEGSGRRSPVRLVEEAALRNVGEEKTATREPPNDVVATEEAESLENPVVSLECFIFL